MAKAKKSVVVAATVTAVALATVILVATKGPRGGRVIKEMTPVGEIVRTRDGGRKATVVLGKRGGKVEVYSAKGKKTFSPREVSKVA